jgi:hypothetical protein
MGRVPSTALWLAFISISPSACDSSAPLSPTPALTFNSVWTGEFRQTECGGLRHCVLTAGMPRSFTLRMQQAGRSVTGSLESYLTFAEVAGRSTRMAHWRRPPLGRPAGRLRSARRRGTLTRTWEVVRITNWTGRRDALGRMVGRFSFASETQCGSGLICSGHLRRGALGRDACAVGVNRVSS